MCKKLYILSLIFLLNGVAVNAMSRERYDQVMQQAFKEAGHVVHAQKMQKRIGTTVQVGSIVAVLAWICNKNKNYFNPSTSAAPAQTQASTAQTGAVLVTKQKKDKSKLLSFLSGAALNVAYFVAKQYVLDPALEQLIKQYSLEGLILRTTTINKIQKICEEGVDTCIKRWYEITYLSDALEHLIEVARAKQRDDETQKIWVDRFMRDTAVLEGVLQFQLKNLEALYTSDKNPVFAAIDKLCLSAAEKHTIQTIEQHKEQIEQHLVEFKHIADLVKQNSNK